MIAGTNSIRIAVVLYSVLLILFGCEHQLPEKKKPRSASLDLPVKKPTRIVGKKLLLVHSYHPEYPWVHSITEGVRQGLKGSGVVLDVFYMDTKRRTDEAWKKEAGELARQKVSEWQPDVVITSDDNAQQYFALSYVGGELPIVFCGVNSDPSKYGYPATNVTGVIERPHFNDTIEFVNEFKPIRRIAMLSSDDPTSVGTHSYMKQLPLDFEVLEFRMESDFDAWKQAVLRYNESVDAIGIFVYHTIQEKGSSKSIAPAAVMQWTIDNATVPTLGFLEFGIKDGLLAGVVESGHEHGECSARYALDLLRGVPIESLPIIKAEIGVKMLNKDTAKRLDIDLSDADLENVLTVPEE